MKLQASLLLLAMVPGSGLAEMSPAKLFKRTLDTAFASTLPRRYTERKLASNMPGLDLNAFTGAVTPAQLKMLSKATDDYWGSLLPAMFDKLTVEDASAAFDLFPFLKTMPAYKDFLATGSNDPVKMGAAQLGALQDMLVSTAAAKSKMQGEGSSVAMFDALVKEGNADLVKDVEAVKEGDVQALHRVQQAYVDKYFGGADVKAMYDNTFIDQSRTALETDDMMKRLIGTDNGILDILTNKDVRLLDPTHADFNDHVRRLHTAMNPMTEGEE